jgi:hypothetical protein
MIVVPDEIPRKESIIMQQTTKPTGGPQGSKDSLEGRPMHEDIAALAYSLWQARGCPEGTPEEDWLSAEEALRDGAGA